MQQVNGSDFDFNFNTNVTASHGNAIGDALDFFNFHTGA
jgi:hypothetical protein